MAISRSLGQLTIDLVAKVGGWTGGLDKAERELKSRTSRMERNLRSFRNTLTTTFAALGVGALVRSIVRETAQTEHSLAQLDAALRSTGNAAGYTREQLVGMADELASASTFRSSDIIDAQTRLLSYSTIVGETVPKAMQTVIDQSARLGVSLTQSAEIIGRALETPSRGVTALTQQGFQFTESQRSVMRQLEATGRVAEAQQIILDVLEESYGGAARAARDTFGGALDAVKNGFRDLLVARDGLPAATEELNNFADLLRDPTFVQSANVLTSAVIKGFSEAAGFIARAAAGIRSFSESLAAAVSGPAYDDLERTRDRIEKLREEIENLQSLGRIDRLFSGGRRVDGWIEERRSELAKLQAQYESASAAAETLANSSRESASGGGGEAAPPPASEAFLKLEAALKQQIALYGSVGDAAKIAYQIASGQLDELSDKEQQRVLALAREYDAIVESAKAVKERQQAQEQLVRSFDQQVANYERQIALTGEVTELERIRYEIAHGGLVGINDEQRERLELLAEEVEELQRIAKIQSEGASLTDSLRTPLEQYEESIKRFNELHEEQAITDETYLRAVIKAQEDLKKATEETNEFLEQANRNVQDILASSIENNFRDGFKGILRDFESMLTKMAAQAIAAQIGQKLFGGAGMGSGGGLLGGFLGSFFGGGKASGGPVLAGHMYQVNERGPEMLSMDGRDYLMMGRQSGQVIPNERITTSPRPVNQIINVTGSVSQRSARQLALETAQAQRIAAMRLA